jgi:tRNA(fMet)-specific endonuclease VapC
LTFLLDTCTVSAHLKRPSGLQARFVQYSGRLYLSALSLAELYVLAFRLDDPTPRVNAIEALIRSDLTVIDFDADSARFAGQVRADLLRRGLVVPAVDLLIGAVALTYDMILVTNNLDDFRPIPGLRLVDWVT